MLAWYYCYVFALKRHVWLATSEALAFEEIVPDKRRYVVIRYIRIYRRISFN
jgi:hypothetical protein